MAFASRASASRVSRLRRRSAPPPAPRPPRLGLLGAGLKPGPGLLGRGDLRFQPGPQPGLVPLGVPAGLRRLLLRGPAYPVQLRPGRLGRLPRPRRVLSGLGHPRLGPGRPGLRAGHRLVPFLPRRGHLLPRGPRLLLGGGLRLPRLGQPRLRLRRRSGRLLRLGQPRLGLLGAGLKPGPGLLGRGDLRFQPGPQPGLVPLGVPAGLRHLLLRGPAYPVQLRPGRLSRLPRPRRVLSGLGHPRLGPGRPGLRAGHRLVPFLPRRGHLLPRGPRLLSAVAFASRASASRVSACAAARASCASASRASACSARA